MRSSSGPLLTVDVGRHSARTADIDEELSAFVGGRGVGTKLAHDRIPFDADPLGPENALFFAAGPLQTASTSFTGRLSCTGVSPLTGGLLSSNAGGFLSRNFVATGYPVVSVTGESDDLLAVHVRDDGVEFEPVPELAGAETSAVSAYVKQHRDLGPDATACVGPAGENRVRFASIMTTEHRTFGRGGLGAVLGAKGVKLLTFDGESTRTVPVDDDVAATVHREASTSDSVMKRQGTASLTEFANEVEALPTRYFEERSFEGADAIGGDRVEEKKYRRGTCSQCAFACKLPTRAEATGLETEGPEFETVMAFGSNCGVDDIVSVMRANDRCDELGMDTISCGAAVAAALASEDAFGDSERVAELVEAIAHREGLGDDLAEGVDRVHDRLGVGNWTMKGMEFAAHDGRALNGQALAFATANRGADHLYGSMYTREYPLTAPDRALDPEGLDGKAAVLVEKENHNAVLDSAIACKFSRGVLTDERMAALLDTSTDRLRTVGERVVDLERHFNNQRGFDRAADDALPYEIEGLSATLTEYYEQRGWTPDGIVPPGKIG
jgi:aldehyde:ferredoxin oxidoreductase